MPIQVPVTQTGLEASIQAAAQRAGRNLKIDLGVSSRSIGGLSQPLGKITGQADQFTKSMEAANARVLAFGASVGVLSAVAQGFKSIIATTIQVEKSLADINSVLGANTAQLNKFKNDIFSVAKETGNSFQTVSDAALELSRQGLKSDEVLRRLKDSMVLSRLSGLDAASAVEGLTAAVNSFSKEGLTTTEVLNKIAKTAAAYSVSERDLVEGFKRSASVAQQAGVSIDELGGIITAVQQKTARGGAVIGNAFKTIFTRIQRPESLAALQEVGAAVTDMQGGILPATKLIENLAQKMNSLNDIQKANITEKIGGGFQIGPLLAALDDITSKTSTFKGATEAMATAGNEAYARNTALNKTLAASINEATVNLQELANTLGEIGVTDSLKNILSFFNSFATNVKDLLQGEGLGSDFAKGIVKGIGGILSGPGLLLFGAIIAKLSINFIQFGATALKTFFNIGSAAKEIGAIQSTIASTLLNNKSIQTQILALEGNRVAQAQFFSTALNTQLATMEKMRTIAASIAPTVYGATTGAGKPRAAGGYMPTVMAEANDINKGVGGARPSDKPVIIPNFNFGGGKKGTMVANTGEHIVPNFGGSGGSAVFNRDMVGRMGLPSNAQKINSADGFIPNFAKTASAAEVREYANNIEQYRIGNSKTFKFPSGGTMTEAGIKTTLSSIKAKSFGNLARVNAEGIDFGMIVGERGAGQMASRYADDKGRITSNPTESSKYLIDVPIHRINDKNLKFKESSKITEQLSKVSASVALKMAKDLSGGQIPEPENIELIQSLLNKGALASTSGAIFEAGIAGILKDKDFSDFSSQDRGSLIDFKPYGRIKELFGIQNGQSTKGLEAKANSGPDLISSVAGKILKVEKGQSAFGKAASGYIPNFANYIYDSDKLPAELRASILPAILASKKRKDGILGPAGAGKSTMAGGIGQFIQSMEDIAKATGFTILSAAGLAKTPTGISKQFQPILDSIKRSGGSLKYLNVDNEEIKRRREARVATGGNDLRSEAQLKGTSYAPLNQPEFLDILKKEMGGNLQIVNGASGYVPNFVNESYITDTLKRIKDGTSGFSKQEQEMFLKKFGASAKVGNKGISLRKVFDTLDSENGISAMVDKAYRAAGPTASMDQVFQVFSKQIAANPEGLRNLVKQKGFVPNFADPLKEAISREVGAGVDPSQVYVDQHSSLKNSGNPMGLMVANRRDEPQGGWQGINRARKEGANAQMYGAAEGFIPNYAAKIPEIAGQVKAGLGGATFSKQVEDAVNEFGKKAIAAGGNMEKLSKALESKLKSLTNDAAASKAVADESRKQVETIKSARAIATQESAAKKQSLSNQILSNESNKKLASQLDKIYQQYNKSQKTTQDLQNAQAKAAAVLNKTSLSQRTQAAVVRSTASLAENRKSAQITEKGSGDMLGKVFALQAGFSALSAATSDAAGSVGKYTNIVSEGLSSGTTAVFALQGLSSALPQFAGFLGPAGLAVGALTAAYQIGGQIADEVNGINKSAAESMNRVAEAAKNASVKLEDLSDFQQKSIKSRSESLVYGASQETSAAQAFFTGPTVNYEGFDLFTKGELQKSLDSMSSSALAAGASYDEMFNIIRSKAQDGLMSKKDIEDLSIEISKLIPSARKVSQEINALNLNPFQGFGAELADMSNVDLDKTLKEIEYNNKIGKTDERFSEIRNALYKGGMKDTVGEGAQFQIRKLKENLDLIKNQKIIDTDNAANSVKFLDGINGSLQKTKDYIIDLQSRSFKFTNIISAFKGISEAAIENSYNFSEYQKSIEKFNISIEGIKASSAVSKLNLIKDTTDKLAERAKSSSTLGLPINTELLDEISAAINSGGNAKDIINENKISLNNLFGSEYPKFIEETTKEFQKQTKEINNQSQAEENNLRIETYRSLVAQQTTVALENQNKKLELQQNSAEKIFQYSEKIRDSQNKISDLKFEKSVIGKTQIERLRVENTRKPELQQRAIDQARFNFKQENIQSIQGLQSLIPSTLSAESQFNLKNNILNATGNIRNNQGGLEQISNEAKKAYDNIIGAINASIQEESKSRQDTISKLKETLLGTTVTFSDSVISAAKEFKKIVTEAAKEPERQNLGSEISQKEINQAKDREALRKLNIEAARILGLQSKKQTSPSEDIELQKKDKVKKQIDDLTKEIASNEVKIKGLKNKLNELNTSNEAPAQTTSDTSNLVAKLKKFIFTFEIPPLIARPTNPTEAPAITPISSKNAFGQGLNAATTELEATLMELSNAHSDRIDQIEKQTSITRILTDRFKELRDSVPANIAALIGTKNKSISGEEISRTNYDVETQRQLSGAKSKEEQDAIIRKRQNKSVGQLFDEKFYKTPEELSLRLKTTLVDASVQFKENLIDGITQAVEKGGSLSDILRNAALEFARSMTKAALGNMFDGVSSMFGIKRASGGPINGGSGNKDDVPAMLMGGEYVMNKKAVSKYGSGFMEALNNGSISGYARGGPVIRDRGLGSDVINASNVRNQTGKGGFQMPGYYGAGTISGKKNLLSYASQSYTSGAGDIIRGGGDSSYIDLTPESVRLTNFGRNQGPMADAVKESKKEALGLYFQQLAAEKQAREEEKAKKKAFKRAIIGALITSAIGSVVGAGASGFKAGVAGAGKDAGFFEQLGAGAKGIFSGGDVGGGTMVGGLRNLFSGNYQLSQISDLKGYQQYLNGNTQGTDKILAGSTSKDITGLNNDTFSDGFDATDAISYANNLTKGRANDVSGIGVNNYSLFKEPDLSNDKNYLFNGTLLPSRATGGRIPQTSGIDTVPAMLSGGEFIMNAGATQRIGASNLNAMNSGASTDTSSSAINDQLISKIDELIRVTKESSKPVTVNVSSQQGQTSGDNQQDGGSQKDQNLSKKIRDAVVQVLQEEKRLGGVLRRS